jgi:NAD(P)H-dependent FMN reductase
MVSTCQRSGDHADHASRPYRQSAWAGKPAGVLGASIGAIVTSMAQQHLRNVLAYLAVTTLGQPEAFIHAKEGLFDEAGNIGAESRKFLQGLDGSLCRMGEEALELMQIKSLTLHAKEIKHAQRKDNE